MPTIPAGQLETMYACDFPPTLSSAAAGTIIGPEAEPGGYWVGQVLARRAARLDRATRTNIEDILFRDWLAERRKEAAIRWHWM